MIKRRRGFYEKYIKRLLDVVCALFSIGLLWWLYIVVAVLVRIRMGSPILFKQSRPGMIDPKTGKECIFDMYKFRTMTDKKDESGKLLPDEKRLGSFGKTLRRTSLDEIPEVINILKGDMSFIGPRPMLVRDMVFMDEKTRMRHTAKPGMSGLAQVNGRNAVSWEKKFEWDLKYIENVDFVTDIKIFFQTILKVFIKPGSVDVSETDLESDYGDTLLEAGRVSREEYDALQIRALELIREHEGTR